MEFLFYALVAVLAGGAGYCGGRWHGAAVQAGLKNKLESDTEHFMELLEERNQAYVNFKARSDERATALRDVQLALDKSEQRMTSQKEVEQELRDQLQGQDEKLVKFKAHLDEQDEERQVLREERASLRAEVDSYAGNLTKADGRLKMLEERSSKALMEKASLQAELVAKEREAREFQRQAQKLEDSHDASELSLSQMRVSREEMVTRLAYAEGQLDILTPLKQSLMKNDAEVAPSEPPEDWSLSLLKKP